MSARTVMLTRRRLKAIEEVVCLALASDIEGEPENYGGVTHADMLGALSWIQYQRERRGWNSGGRPEAEQGSEPPLK